MDQNVTMALAFAAGVLSFLSPCVLPLVPIYLGYLTGSTLGMVEGEAAPPRRITFFHALSFVGGFSTLFIILGASVGLVGYFLIDQLDILVKIGAVLVIILGLHLIGVIKIPLLYREKRLDVQRSGDPSYLASFAVGMVFAAGWTPCVGPVLAGILLMAGASGTVAQGALLLTVYSIGLGVPFLLTALLLSTAINQFRRLNRYMRVIEVGSGLLLIAAGILLFTGNMQVLNGYLNSLFMRLGLTTLATGL